MLRYESELETKESAIQTAQQGKAILQNKFDMKCYEMTKLEEKNALANEQLEALQTQFDDVK